MLRHFFNRIYNENLDTDEIINAVQPELDALSDGFQNHFDDTFPLIATENGILKWEIILGIVPDPVIESLEFRRGRILNRLSSNVPYTERALRQIMDDIMGTDTWSYDLDYQNYQLDITSLRPGRNWLNEMELTLAKIIPANLIWFLHIYYANWELVYSDFMSWGEIYELGKTWQEVMEGV